MDLSSNDYLGLSHHPNLINAAFKAMHDEGVGAGGSQLVTGGRPIHRKLEHSLANWLRRERVFIFPSGFQANLAAVMALANRNTTVFIDRLAHYSLLTGVKASGARMQRFVHNDASDLRRRLKNFRKNQSQNQVLVITESLFSMEGTNPPLKEIVEICTEHNAKLLVDEAHALGIMGDQGRGLCFDLGHPLIMITGTFGKAFGSGGAFLACDQEVGEEFLQNSGPFRYTTALAPPLAASTYEALNLITANPKWGVNLIAQAKSWRNHLESAGWERPLGNGPIISLIIGNDQQALSLQQKLEHQGLLCVAIRPPTVPENTSRLRIVVRKNLPKEALDKLMKTIGKQ